MNQKYIVDGFLFTSEADYNAAKEDHAAIEFFKEKTDLSDPEIAYKLYNRIISRGTFRTIVGYSFLKEIQNKLIESNYKPIEELEKIPVENFIQDNNEMDTLMIEKYQSQAVKSKERLKTMGIINVALTITIILMFIIALLSDKTVFTKFENQVIDRYASWEEELRDREEKLLIRENEIKDQLDNLEGNE